MAVQAEDFLVNVVVDSKGAVKGFMDATGAVVKFGKEVEKSNTKLGRFQQTFKEMGAAVVVVNQGLELAAKVARATSAAVGATVGEYAKLERALIAVGKTTSLSDNDLATLGSTLQEMSQEIPVSANELLELAAIAGQLGVNGADNLENFAETMGRMAVASDLAGEEGAKAMIRILNATNETPDAVDNLAAAIVELGNNVAATESEIARMANEIARTTGVFGFSAAEAAGLGAAMREVGVRAELGGSVVGKALREMDLAIRQGGASMERLVFLTGLSGDELRKQFGDAPAAVFTKFVEGLGRVQKAGGSVSQVLEGLNLKGDEVNKVLPVLAGNAERLAGRFDMARKAAEEATALIEESDKVFATLGAQFETTRNAIENLASDVGAIFAPAATKILEVVQDIVESMRDLARAVATIDFVDAAKSVGILTAAFIALKGALEVKGAIAAIGGISAAIAAMGGKAAILATVAAGMGKLATAMKAVALAGVKFAAIAIAVASVAAAIDIVIRNFDKLGDVGKTLSAALKFVFIKIEQGINFLALKFAEAMKAMAEAVTKIPLIGDAFKKDVDASDKMIDRIKRQAATLETQLEAARKNLGDASKDVDFGLAGQIVNFIRELTKAEEKTKDVADGSKDAADQQQRMAEAAQQTAAQMQAITDAINANIALNKQLELIGASQEQAIQIRLSHAIDEVDRAQALAESQGTITDELREQLKLQREMLQLIADAELAALARAQTEKTVQDILSDGNKAAKSLENIGIQNLLRIGRRIAAEKRIKKIQLEQLDALEESLSSAGAMTDERRDDLALARKLANQLGKVPSIGLQIAKSLDMAFLDGFVEKFSDEIRKAIEAAKDGDFTGVINVSVKGLSKLGETIGSTFGAIFDTVKTVFDPSFWQGIADFLTNALKNFPKLLTQAFSSLMSALDEFIANAGEVFRDLINKIPGFIQEIVKRIPALIKLVTESFGDLMDAMPAIFASILDRLPEMIDLFLQGATEALGKLLDVLPVLITQIIDKIPEIINVLADNIGPLIETILEKLPDIILAIVNGIIRNLPDIVAALIKLIGKAIFGLIRGIGKFIVNLIKGLFTGQDFEIGGTDAFVEKVTEATDKISQNLTGVTDELFSVIEIGAVKRGETKANEIAQAIVGATERSIVKMKGFFDSLGEFGAKIWHGFLAAIGDVVAWFKARGSEVWDGFLKPIGEWFTERGKAIWDGFFVPIGNAFGEMGTAIWTAVTTAIGDLASTFGGWGTAIWNGFLLPIGNFFGDMGTAIWTGLTAAIGLVADTFGAFGSAIWTGLTNMVGDIATVFGGWGSAIWDGLIAPIGDFFKNLGNDIWTGLKDAFDVGALVPGSSGSSGSSEGGLLGGRVVPGILHSGGPVTTRHTRAIIPGLPKYATGGSIDDRLIQAQVGEFMLQRSAVDGIGLNAAEFINRTGSLPQQSAPQITIGEGAIVINEASSMSGREIAEEVLEQIKRRSIDREFLLSDEGLRSV